MKKIGGFTMVKKYVSILIVLYCIVFVFSSCQDNDAEDTFFSMDTFVTVRLGGKIEKKDKLFEECRGILKELEQDLSSYSSYGSVYDFNNSSEGAVISTALCELISISNKVSGETDGAFSVFSGALTELWRLSDADDILPDPKAVESALGSIVKNPVLENNFLRRENGCRIETGGIAKGYACDRLVEYLKANGVSAGLVSFTSSIGVIGNNPSGKKWKIAVKDPFDTDGILGYVSVSDAFISVSGDYERWYEINGEKYCHIIDLKSGRPVLNGVREVVVVCDNGAEGDALSTAFFAMGADAVAEKYGSSTDIKYLIVTDDGVFMNDSMREIFSEK